MVSALEHCSHRGDRHRAELVVFPSDLVDGLGHDWRDRVVVAFSGPGSDGV